MSSARGVQAPGWKGRMASFQDSTASKWARSGSKPGIRSSGSVVSGVAELLNTSSTRRSASSKRSESTAAASVAAPYSVEAQKIWVVGISGSRLRCADPAPQPPQLGGAAQVHRVEYLAEHVLRHPL